MVDIFIYLLLFLFVSFGESRRSLNDFGLIRGGFRLAKDEMRGRSGEICERLGANCGEHPSMYFSLEIYGASTQRCTQRETLNQQKFQTMCNSDESDTL